MVYSSVSILVLLSVITGGLLAQIPEYIKICRRDQSTVASCVRNSIESLRPQLISGIPELNVPSLEPFYIPEIIAVSGDLVPLKASGKDVKVSGAGNFSIKSISVDLDTLTIRGRVRFPRLHLDGRYNLDTQILILPLRGEGNLVANAVKCEADILLRSRLVMRDGKQYLEFTSLKVDIGIKDYRIRLEGLFNGNKALGDATNEAIHQNRVEFLKTMLPYLEKTVSKILLDTANKIVAPIPFDELLPKP
ncbi:circadian clock-controlled protein daywake-like [Maniola hyperantus]|uniref:circadian clock-controlled protein daywake-like n=1 Tax=Aphantopus hyperantus TaxID=2795564 RepID=UPI00156892B5|nr:circadian clock-controlled protein-like [Maniola hyperantus]